MDQVAQSKRCHRIDRKKASPDSVKGEVSWCFQVFRRCATSGQKRYWGSIGFDFTRKGKKNSYLTLSGWNARNLDSIDWQLYFFPKFFDNCVLRWDATQSSNVLSQYSRINWHLYTWVHKDPAIDHPLSIESCVPESPCGLSLSTATSSVTLTGQIPATLLNTDAFNPPQNLPECTSIPLTRLFPLSSSPRIQSFEKLLRP